MIGHYGEIIGRYRLKAGLSRGNLARGAKIAADEIAAIEQSSARPVQEKLVAICNALHVSVDEIDVAVGCLPQGLETAMRNDPGGFLRALAGLVPEKDRSASTAGSRSGITKPLLTTALGNLYQADATGLMQQLPGESVDLFFADPPFNLKKDYGKAVDDALSQSQYLDWCIGWLEQAVRLLKQGGSLFLYNLPKWNLRLGAWLCRHLEFRHWIAVDIKFSLPIPGRLYPSHYALLYFTKGTKPACFSPPRLPIELCRHCSGELKDYGGYKNRMNPAGVNLTDVWTDLAPVRHSRFKRRKANELPLKMMDRILDIASNKGDLVLDPFGGSGTTYIAAELKGRRWIGAEIADCQPIVDRFAMIDKEIELLEKIHANVNVLFTEKSLQRRASNGLDTSRYRLPSTGVAGKKSG
jgi:site-specific DNA-methyltransferase (adenine-specific)